MVRRLFTPRWILIHLGVISLIVLMINLGLWQLDRLDNKRRLNEAVAERAVEPVAPYSQIRQEGLDNPKDLEWRRVSLEGKYLTEKPITLINRSSNGSAGYNSLVPFQLENGDLMLVNRGFVPLATANPKAPEGSLQIVGFLRVSQSRSALGAIDNTDANNTEFQRVDIPLIMKSLGAQPLEHYLQLVKESPTTNAQWPEPVALPEPSEGSHLSYAFQWFFFCAVAFVAWVVVIRRRLRETTTTDGLAAPSGTSA
jgi:cytochrome oxidase assembly protein ShyY1